MSELFPRQQRLGLAQAILNKPKLLVLDEPFSGLDPLGRREVRELLLRLRSEGSTIFMSSHILSDVEDICDRVAIMARGEVKSVFALRDAPRLYGEAFSLTVLCANEQPSLMEKLRGLADNFRTDQTNQGDVITLRFDNYLRAHRTLADALAAGLRIISFENTGLSLEDVFLRITSEGQPVEPAMNDVSGAA